MADNRLVLDQLVTLGVGEEEKELGDNRRERRREKMKKKNWGRRSSNECFSHYITPINGTEKKNVLVNSSDKFILSPNYIPIYPTL